MRTGIDAIQESGMPSSHARVFQSVADLNACVIASRQVGKLCTGLLLESYATKGFHNKAKSCNWGPMAGFVMADPRFTKNLDAAGQRKDLYKAVHDGGGEIPLFITDERRKDLEGPLGCIKRAGGNINEMVYAASVSKRSDEPGKAPTRLEMNFVLRRSFDAPGAAGKQLWAVFYGAAEKRLSNDLKSPNVKGAGDLLPVMAMVDPACPKDVRKTYRAATTGDYDLFSVFALRENYDPKSADRRMVPGSDRFKTGIQSYMKYENPDRGNLTIRIAAIAHALNTRIRVEAGYHGGDVVHHSDEAGRPNISSIDFPFIAFIPGQQPVLAESVVDFKRFIGGLTSKYVLGLNPGWFKQLGFGVSAGGSYEA